MNEIIRFSIILLLFAPVFTALAAAIRFERWSDTESGDLVYGIPFLFVAVAAAGALWTVGIFGITSAAGIPLLLFSAWYGKIKIRKPKLFSAWTLTALALSILFLGIKAASLYDPVSDQLLCSFHDDYSYVSQINLLQQLGKESHFSELVRLAFQMDYAFKIYHLAEFYFLLIPKEILGGSSFLWFQFFLKPFLNVAAVLSCISFFYSSGKKGGPPFLSVALISTLFFTTLRFNLLDDAIRNFLPSEYWKAVFFQNYYFPAPLSYHVSYKISLAFIFIIPLFYIWKKPDVKSGELFIFSGLAGLVSIALIPFCTILSAKKIACHFLSRKQILLLSTAGIIVVLAIRFFSLHPLNLSALLRFGFAEFFHGFNLVFENHYWHLFYFSVFCLLFVKRGPGLTVFLMLILAFPLVYLEPSVLFKIYSSVIVLSSCYLFYRNQQILKNEFLSVHIPALVFLFVFTRLLPGVANLGQVFSNMLFPVICLMLLEWLFLKKLRLSAAGIALSVLFLLQVNLPAIAYDNKTPLHREKIQEEFFHDAVFQQPLVNVLSISAFGDVPFIDKNQLGQGILNRTDRVVITMGGFENLSSKDISIFQFTGHIKALHRLPAYEETILQKKPVELFIRERKIRIVLIEKNPRFLVWLNRLKPLSSRIYQESEKGYYLLVMK